jgi:hypothetical protein
MGPPNPDDTAASSDPDDDRPGDPVGIAACGDLEREDGPTVVFHEDNDHEWVQSDLVFDRAAMR